MKLRTSMYAGLAAFAAAGCGGAQQSNQAAAPEAMPSDQELARDAALANEAAADEAADTNNFGGSAAETPGNGGDVD